MSAKIDLSLDIASTSTKDAKQWVQKSRTSQPRIVQNDDENNNDEELHSQQATKKRKLASSNSNNYAGNDLKGLQVMHGMKDFEQGHEVILTLADTNILATDEHGKVIGISEGDDMLENVNFAERERIHDREKQLKKLRQGSHYSGYDDAEFEEGFHPGMKPSMLSKYDKEKRKTAKLILLGENEVSSQLSPEERELQENQKTNPLLQRKYQSLQNDLRQGSSYLTQEEIKFKKSSKDRKNKAKIRQKQPTTSVEEETTGGGGNEDYDLRNILGDGGNATTNGNNDNNNIDLSANESKVSSSAISAPKQPKLKFDSFVFEDEDPDLSLALAKARQLALQKRQQEEKKQKKNSQQKMETDEQQEDEEEEELEEQENDLDRGAKVAREFSVKALEREKKESENKMTTMMDDERTEGKQQFGGEENEGATLEELLDVDSEGRRADGKLVFNSTTEFTTRLQARLNENARSRAEAAMKDMERSSSTRGGGGALDTGMGTGDNEHHRLPTPKKQKKIREPAEGERMEEDKEAGEDEEGEEPEEEGEGEEGENDWAEMEDESEEMSITSSQRHPGEYEEDPLGFPNTQPVLSKGLGATLDLLRATGELKKTNRLAGRAKDDRANDPSNEERGITIEYRDEFGRKLTQKEAFRQLSYKFHGYGPGKKKADKRLQQVKEERKVVKKRAKVLEGDTGTLKNLTKTQEATGKAHLVIQGGTSSVPASVISKMASTMAKKK
jgi:U4/U6.U5 tri-snRNP-associated protein 1